MIQGRYPSHTVIEDLEGCPETGFEDQCNFFEADFWPGLPGCTGGNFDYWSEEPNGPNRIGTWRFSMQNCFISQPRRTFSQTAMATAIRESGEVIGRVRVCWESYA